MTESVDIKERSPEAQEAYWQGYQAGAKYVLDKIGNEVLDIRLHLANAEAVTRLMKETP